MSRLKSLFAIALLIAVAGIVQQANAVTNTATIKLMVAGSSALWQSMALGAYGFNATGNPICPPGAVKPCFHYTSNTFSLNDNRPATFAGQSKVVDANNGIWIIWDSHVTTTASSGTFSTPNVWAFIKVDTAVGDRCYFAHPRCFTTTNGSWVAPNQQISSALWGADTDPNSCGGTCNGAPVVSAFQAATGVVVGAAASDIRPEDALWATCRVNSALSGDTLGLGYNTAIPAGQCPTSATAKTALAGTDIISEVNSGHTAHAVAWNISGTDPYSGQAIPAFTSVSIGAEPIVFVAGLTGASTLPSVTNVTDSQVQNVFSGTNCNATALGAGADPLDVFMREPLSGTMNTVEYTVFAYPDFSGTSQETGVGTPTGTSNPLNKACAGGGGTRKRGIGTGDIVTGIFNDQAASNDSIGYIFFSYGNVTNGGATGHPINDSANFKYFTLNGVDPIFHKYISDTAHVAFADPGQPTNFVGEIPGPADFSGIAGCTASTCAENKIWNGGLSFPNVRNGQYRAWSILRIVSDGANLTTAKGLVTLSNEYAAGYIPDYAPVVAVPVHTTGAIINPADPGLFLLRSHYQQKDNNGVSLGGAPVDDSTTGDKGGDVGGCIEHALPGVSTAIVAQNDSTLNQTQAAPGSTCVVFTNHATAGE